MSFSTRLRTVLSVGSALGVCAGGVAVATVSAAPIQSPMTLASNQSAAHLDAARLLSSLRLPAAAAASLTEPSGAYGALVPLESLVASPARAVVHGWWTVPGSPSTVRAYVRAHPPIGAKLEESGSGTIGPAGAAIENVAYTWPAIAGVIGARELAVTVTALPDRVTGVLAQAQSDWIVPRPAGELVPAATREIDITIAKLDGPIMVSRRVTTVAKVRGIVAVIDAMPTVQPGASGCGSLTADGGARVIRFKFRSRLGAPGLAQATYTAYPPLTQPSGQCNPVQFSIAGRSRPALIGGSFIKQIRQVLGVPISHPSDIVRHQDLADSMSRSERP